MTASVFTSAAAEAAKAISVPEIAVVEDLVRYLRCSPSTVRRLLRLGVLPGRKIGRRWIIERRALLAALGPAEADQLGGGRSLTLLPGRDRKDHRR